MSKQAMQKSCDEMADNIEMMISTLKRRGFSEEQSVQMVAGMLASSQTYVPFAVQTPSLGDMH